MRAKTPDKIGTPDKIDPSQAELTVRLLNDFGYSVVPTVALKDQAVIVAPAQAARIVTQPRR